MSDRDAMEEAVRRARRTLDVDDVIRAAEKNGGHITFGRGEPTLGEFVDWIQAHRGDVMGEEITAHRTRRVRVGGGAGPRRGASGVVTRYPAR